MKTHQDDPDEDQADDNDEYSTRDAPRQPSFYQKYGFDERDGPPEEEESEERGYEDDPDDRSRNELDYRRR